jgi:hypothetical protein
MKREKDEGLIDFLQTLKYWLSMFPRRLTCDNCGRKIWAPGKQAAALFCGQRCFDEECGIPYEIEF